MKGEWKKLYEFHSMISGFRCEADEKSIPLGYYAASSGNS
jgi:hypothetical protein